MSPLVSVIVPCYNQAQYLEEALESVLAQTYKNWECIVVNDGSPDHTEDIAKEWCNKDSRFKYFLKKNGGVSSARNAGIENSTGEYILPLDADDLIHPQYLELAVNSFRNNERVSLVYCKAEKFGIDKGDWILDEYNYRKLLLNNHIFCSAIYRKECWIRACGYDERFKKGYEDWDFWIKILNEDSLVLQLQKKLFYYRTKESSRTKDMQLTDHETERWHIYINNLKIYKERFISPISIINQNINLESQNILLQSQIKKVTSSYSYKIGNLLLRPLSYFKRSFYSEK